MKEDSPKASAELLLKLSKEVERLAGSLAQLSMGYGVSRLQHDQGFTSNELEVPLERVNRLIRIRRERGRYLPRELFADPAWDILLDLLRAEIAHERISVSSACIVANTPPTTGLRWLNALEQRGLVLRDRDTHDARRTFVRLSPDASRSLRRYFIKVVGTSGADQRI